MPRTENAWVAGTLSALFWEFEKWGSGKKKKKKKPEGRIRCVYVLSRGNVAITAHSCAHKTHRTNPTLKDRKTSQLLINQITQTTCVELR